MQKEAGFILRLVYGQGDQRRKNDNKSCQRNDWQSTILKIFIDSRSGEVVNQKPPSLTRSFLHCTSQDGSLVNSGIGNHFQSFGRHRLSFLFLAAYEKRRVGLFLPEFAKSLCVLYNQMFFENLWGSCHWFLVSLIRAQLFDSFFLAFFCMKIWKNKVVRFDKYFVKLLFEDFSGATHFL